MYFKFCIKFIFCFLITIKLAFAEIVDVNNEQITELSNSNIPIVDVRKSSEWKQTGVIPNSILLTFFNEEGDYNYHQWYEKLRLEIDESKPIILICRSGKRSKIIAQMMNENFDHVIYNAKRGIISWINEKLITVEPQIN
ncbi:rhodanese-like domain-containing protein [Pelagibacteraceae bacterium]|nr:rhodanese-like domain-containing protein [Pelagibacteraceae bacterium]